MEFSHFDRQGLPRMVDVGSKAVSQREAVASSEVIMAPATLERLQALALPKGDALVTARLAGIAAAKETFRLIPLCHPLALDLVEVTCTPIPPDRVEVRTRVRASGRTGVEMEAMTAAAVAALTIYDMIKAVDREAHLGRVVLQEKRGGKSGEFNRGKLFSHPPRPLGGKVVSVNLSREKGVRKVPVSSGRLVEGQGLEGDAHAGEGPRQVSLLAQESIEKMQGRGLVLSFGDFAENLTVSGLELFTLPLGTRLRVEDAARLEEAGPGDAGALLEVSQIGKLCHTGCDIRRQVGDCVMPREGIFARVLQGGRIGPGALLVVEEGESRGN